MSRGHRSLGCNKCSFNYIVTRLADASVNHFTPNNTLTRSTGSLLPKNWVGTSQIRSRNVYNSSMTVFDMNWPKVDKLGNKCATPLLLASFIFPLLQKYTYLKAPTTVTANQWNVRYVWVHMLKTSSTVAYRQINEK